MITAEYYACYSCGEPLSYEHAYRLFGALYCADCASEILTEHDVLEDD